MCKLRSFIQCITGCLLTTNVKKKLKLPVKAIRVLILIMIFVQTCRCGEGACFGSISKVRIRSDLGDVGINNTRQIILFDDVKYFYKISGPKLSLAFYLFEESTQKFLCWKKSRNGMVVMDYKRIKRMGHWDLCKFRDKPADKQSKTHVNLYLADYPKVRMQFLPNRKLALSRKMKNCPGSIEKCMKHMRHHKKRYYDEFMLIPPDKPDCCPRAYKMFCGSKMRDMDELRDICKELRPKRGNCN